MMTASRLKLHARSVEDLTVISAALQDALVPLGDISHIPEDKSFLMVVNRFRWEQEGAQNERIHAGLRFDAVRKVQFRGIERSNRSQFLSFLAIVFDGGEEDEGAVVMHFAGGGAIRLSVGGLYCVLADLGQSWPTEWKPLHKPD